MFTVVLAALIVQATASPDARATLPAGSQIIRRMPDAQPRIVNGDVVIRNSGSTNTRGYSIVVHPDYSAAVTDAGGQLRRTVVNAPQAKWLFAKVREALPFAALPVERCMKSASFGSALSISYRGSTTPDLSCGGAAVVRELSRTAGVIAAQAGASNL